MKTVLVTGATGFVGTHLINELKDIYSVLGIFNTKNPTPQTNVLYKQLDLTHKPAVFQTITSTKPDVIIHLAAITKTHEPDLQKLMDVNFNSTLYLLDAILEVKKTHDYDPKFIYISSAEVYGKTIHPEKIDEENPLYPGNPYGVSKTAADRLCYQYSQTHKLNTIILRPFVHSGPGQETGFFVTDMISQIVSIEKNSADTGIIKVGNLESTRDYLDVRDIVRAYRLAIEKDLPSGETYNICSGKGTKIKSLLDKIIKLSTKKIIIEKDPSRLRPSDIPILIGSNQKFKKATGWKTYNTIDKTISDTLEYWRQKTS